MYIYIYTEPTEFTIYIYIHTEPAKCLKGQAPHRESLGSGFRVHDFGYMVYEV